MEPNAYFEPLFYERQKSSTVKMEKFLLTSAEDMAGVEDNSVDIVVSTLVLSSVANVQQALKEIHRVLAPVRSTGSSSAKIITPFNTVLLFGIGWKILLLGTRAWRTWNLASHDTKSGHVNTVRFLIRVSFKSKHRPNDSRGRTIYWRRSTKIQHSTEKQAYPLETCTSSCDGNRH